MSEQELDRLASIVAELALALDWTLDTCESEGMDVGSERLLVRKANRAIETYWANYEITGGAE